MTSVSPLAPPRRILVVDDDAGTRELISGFLSRHHCRVDTAGDTQAMRERLAAVRYDLVVLDLLLPGEDGLTALRRLQAEQKDAPPVIMLSAVGGDIDRIIGLEVGAEDYLPKPCNPRELLARIAAVLRRAPREPRPPSAGGDEPGWRFAGWRVDLAGHTLVAANGAPVYLTNGEFRLLRIFLEHPCRVLARDQLLDLVHGATAELFDRAVDVQVSRLRRKLEAPDLIRTVRNEGYLFAVRPTRG